MLQIQNYIKNLTKLKFKAEYASSSQSRNAVNVWQKVFKDPNALMQVQTYSYN